MRAKLVDTRDKTGKVLDGTMSCPAKRHRKKLGVSFPKRRKRRLRYWGKRRVKIQSSSGDELKIEKEGIRQSQGGLEAGKG